MHSKLFSTNRLICIKAELVKINAISRISQVYSILWCVCVSCSPWLFLCVFILIEFYPFFWAIEFFHLFHFVSSFIPLERAFVFYSRLWWTFCHLVHMYTFYSCGRIISINIWSGRAPFSNDHFFSIYFGSVFLLCFWMLYVNLLCASCWYVYVCVCVCVTYS